MKTVTRAARPARVIRLAASAALLAALLAGGSGSLMAQEARVLPADEASRDPAFFAFRARLQRAIAERDTAALLAVVHPEIKLSFGGDYGLESFRQGWVADSADGTAGIWSELGTVLALGGRFYDDSTFAAPYTFTDSPDEADPFEALIALSDSVPVRAVPEDDADVIDHLSFEVVRHEWDSRDSLPEGWTAVRLDDGTLGYLRSRSVRSPIDYRAIFSRRDGRWWMATFIAGD
ncbi:MAG TPA: hypothetical protein VJP59_11115 [Gemmatimonadota bacterium]|nr:hypothetical protein [Gemmatimonadota bacterium]